MRPLLFFFGLLLLFAIEILRVYFIMPFPGSQHSDTIGLAYFLDRNVLWLRIAALALVLPAGVYYFRKGGRPRKVSLTALALVYGTLFYFFNFRFLADKMFYPPKVKAFAGGSADTTNRDRLIIGVALRGEARAYPIEIIGYHHQVRDTVGGEPVLVTYCTVCRTGRVFSPLVNGRVASFRLVGMDHFNAMFEDSATKSWWQQATGEAITGPLKGTRLSEIPSAQMRLGDWLALHPDNLTLQPDPNYRARYDSLRGYDEGNIDGSLERKDSGSWKFKSWVIGVSLHGRSKAYDWNQLVRERAILDTLGRDRLLLTIGPDDRSFYVFSLPDSLNVQYDGTRQRLAVQGHAGSWGLDGECLDGPQKGQRLTGVQASQEFWHSWRTFHPGTGRYK
ncbi:MAG: DUF3179 domain-containing (seleno)protein [Bacteroidota bacterium]|nr:DUF3179 domain-containing (seleno)protein [Bacteroidota bacterium]MDP4215167.1 DUF3179 domain-containing (seleno)protein [Bacteroidota bacterium]MDP4247988.1 DUF3179 domain-containing (seleno)protein [Bacteroidota bacterium]MDP4252666.1 DUF3179 domain-containing (seleno)protein [Bacteroidota bacterium]MDP4256689.1 DUF3179 domain-containing (seleno)protein [Bacteroidota bacterium]